MCTFKFFKRFDDSGWAFRKLIIKNSKVIALKVASRFIQDNWMKLAGEA